MGIDAEKVRRRTGAGPAMVMARLLRDDDWVNTVGHPGLACHRNRPCFGMGLARTGMGQGDQDGSRRIQHHTTHRRVRRGGPFVQTPQEGVRFCAVELRRPDLTFDPRFADNPARVKQPWSELSSVDWPTDWRTCARGPSCAT